MKFTQIRSRLVTCLAASVCMLFTTDSGAEDWSRIEAAAKQEGKLLVYSTTSRTAKAAKAFSKSTGIAVEVVRLKEQELITRSYQEAPASRGCLLSLEAVVLPLAWYPVAVVAVAWRSVTLCASASSFAGVHTSASFAA